MSTQRLGKGLQALILRQRNWLPGRSAEYSLRPRNPNPFQPRRHFDEEKLQVCGFYQEYGLLEPVIMRSKGERYELV